MLTPADAALLAKMGTHHNIPGSLFTLDGKDVQRRVEDHILLFALDARYRTLLPSCRAQ